MTHKANRGVFFTTFALDFEVFHAHVLAGAISTDCMTHKANRGVFFTTFAWILSFCALGVAGAISTERPIGFGVAVLLCADVSVQERL
jgi:hypothetical protein